MGGIGVRTVQYCCHPAIRSVKLRPGPPQANRIFIYVQTLPAPTSQRAIEAHDQGVGLPVNVSKHLYGVEDVSLNLALAHGDLPHAYR